MIKKYKNIINDSLGECNVKNLRIENSVDGDSNIMFETTTEDGIEKSCVLLIDVKRNSFKNVLDFINDEFVKEFSRLMEDGTLEIELEEVDHQEHCYTFNGDGCDCEDGYCSDLENDTDSVVAGLGFYIDDDGHWIPNEHDYGGDWLDEESLEPMESYRKLPDGTIEFINEYHSFMFVYKDEEEAKKYK